MLVKRFVSTIAKRQLLTAPILYCKFSESQKKSNEPFKTNLRDKVTQSSKLKKQDDFQPNLSAFKKNFEETESSAEIQDVTYGFKARTEGPQLFCEGKAEVFNKLSESEKSNINAKIFALNSFETLHRDLSVLVIEAFAESLRELKKEKFEGVRMFEGPAAPGLRTVRFAKEIDPALVHSIDACDEIEETVQLLTKNFEHNKLDTTKFKAIQEKPDSVLYKRANARAYDPNFIPQDYTKYDVIDLDPRVNALRYLDHAFSSLEDGGLLGITFKDMNTLAGSQYDRCYAEYNASRVRVPCFEENAIRIMLNKINSVANKQGKYIKPLLSVYSENYSKLFMTIHSSKLECHKSFVKSAHMYTCMECHNFHIQPLGEPRGNSFTSTKIEKDHSKCDQCDSPMYLNGPIWTDKINDIEFVKVVFDKLGSEKHQKLPTNKKIFGMLFTMIQEKSLGNTLMSISLPKLAKFAKTTIPTTDLLNTAVAQHGFRIANSYFSSTLFKTNAPLALIYDLVKQFKKERAEFLEEDPIWNNEAGTPSHKFMNKPAQYKFEFSNIVKSYKPNVPRYIPKEKPHLISTKEYSEK